MKVLIIDNFDSFTYNLYQYVGEILSAMNQIEPFEVIVKRNNEISLDDISHLGPGRIIISPGPGTPSDQEYFGICCDVIKTIGKHTPILGVCLGMQGIAHCFGGKVVRASLPMHGKTSLIRHDNNGLFKGLPQMLEIMRYHSLKVDHTMFPECLEITSVITDENVPKDANLEEIAHFGKEIMGIRHKTYPIEGIQYHPESFASGGGKEVLTNFLVS